MSAAHSRAPGSPLRAARDAERRASHDPALRDSDKKALGIRLSDLGHRYSVLAAELQYLGLPRPTQGNAAWRDLILATASHYRDSRDLAYRLQGSYRPELHTPAPLPAEDGGYLDSLLADAPALCGSGAGIVGVSCPWQRRPWIAFWHDVCAVPDLDSGTCPALEAA